MTCLGDAPERSQKLAKFKAPVPYFLDQLKPIVSDR